MKALRRPIRAVTRFAIIPLAVLFWVPPVLIIREVFHG